MSKETTLERVSWRGVSHPIVQRNSDSLVGVTLGNFDGLHLGHQALFQALDQGLKQLAGLELAGASTKAITKVLFTFYPHPRTVLAKLSGAKLASTAPDSGITDLRSKIALATKFGFSFCISAHFTKEFAELTAECFVERFLVSALNANYVVVGHDWAFGRGREGSLEKLRELGERYNFLVHVVEPVVVDGVRVSTTSLKEALSAGDLPKVRLLLGRPYVVSGRVRQGEKRGSRLGFPTANLEFPKLTLPRDGVYAGWARVGGVQRAAVANLGIRPTFGGGRRVLEVHLLDLQDQPTGVQNVIDIYGHRLEFEFVLRIRDEKKFSGLEELKAQISHDVIQARSLLS